MQFKTNATAPDSELAIRNIVTKKFPDAKLSLDLESADKVLHVHGVPENSETAAMIVRNIEEAGFKGSWITQGDNNL